MHMAWLWFAVVIILLVYIRRLLNEAAINLRTNQALLNSLGAAVSEVENPKLVVNAWVSNLTELTLPSDFDRTFRGLCETYGVHFEARVSNATFRHELTTESRKELVAALVESLHLSNAFVSATIQQRH